MSDNSQQQSKTVSVASLLSHNPLRVVRDLYSRIGELDQRVAALDCRVGAAPTHEQVQSLLAVQGKQVQSLLEVQSNTLTELLNSLNMNVLTASQESANSLVETSVKGVRDMLNAMN